MNRALKNILEIIILVCLVIGIVLMDDSLILRLVVVVVTWIVLYLLLSRFNKNKVFTSNRRVVIFAIVMFLLSYVVNVIIYNIKL